jgi:ADP-ribosyl-[dinitrogen reductase] hydrolase
LSQSSDFFEVSPGILDRAKGVLVASAAGDAVGAPYEFGPPLEPEEKIGMYPHRSFAAGEWTDDTSQALAIARGALVAPLHSDEGAQAVTDQFYRWYDEDRKGIGNQTRLIMANLSERTAENLLDRSINFAKSEPLASGNGSLMRTGPVALSYLADDEHLVTAATRMSELTHAELTCVEACVIWSKAIRHAILFENFDGVYRAIRELEADRADFWLEIFERAEANEPKVFSRNGWVIEAIQVAWSAMSRNDQSDPSHLRKSIEDCVRAGMDTDTTAAIAGALLGARWGASAVPQEWASLIHGWPGYHLQDLESLAEKLVRNSTSPNV